MSDPTACGGCGTVCNLPHVVPACADNTCVLQACEPCHMDFNGLPQDGCEVSVCPSGTTCVLSGPGTCAFDGGVCTDVDGDGFLSCPGLTWDGGMALDCDDNNPDAKPTATEVCDTVDNNCDGVIDECASGACSASPDGGVVCL